MPIDLACDTCGEAFQLKDDFGGRKVKCRSCQSVLVVPMPDPVDLEFKAETRAKHHYPPQFDRDKFFVSQKKIAIGENYFIYDEDKQPILYVRRPARLLRFLGAFLATFVVAVLVALCGVMLAVFLDQSFHNDILSGTVAFGGIIFAIILAVLTMIALMPKRHISFYKDSSKEARDHPLLKVDQDQKVAFLKATYTVRTPDQQVLGIMMKNYLYNFFRKQWRILNPEGELIAIAREDSMILSLLRRFLGPLFGLLRTNFIIQEPETEKVIGEFNRKFTLFDRYVLDLSADREQTIDRRLGLALGVLLDTGERR